MAIHKGILGKRQFFSLGNEKPIVCGSTTAGKIILYLTQKSKEDLTSDGDSLIKKKNRPLKIIFDAAIKNQSSIT